jgi:hypothetical protein
MNQEGRHFSRRSLSFAVLAQFFLCSLLFASQGGAAREEKDWAFLIFLNGNNSLDSFGTDNLKQMETVGSTGSLNIVVQWASEASDKTKRMVIQKSTNSSEVTSPAVETLDRVDMGDYNQLVTFVKWAMEKYPAKHYFIDVWNHGNGWHRTPGVVRDISYDDFSNNHITTPQLGQALRQISASLGRKIDIVGTDACLMAMAEVASEIADSTNFLIGSQEVEPGPGWPYDAFLSRWTAAESPSAADVSRFLVEEYIKVYNSQNGDVTLSALDLAKQGTLESALTQLATSLKALPADKQKKVVAAVKKTLHFELSDYVDLGDLVKNLRTAVGGEGEAREPLTQVENAVQAYVSTNGTTEAYKTAKGVSIWFPDSASTYKRYASYYEQLKFSTVGWGKMLKAMYP